jgi:hypothetical protein
LGTVIENRLAAIPAALLRMPSPMTSDIDHSRRETVRAKFDAILGTNFYFRLR